MPTSVTAVPPVPMNRFQGPIPLHLNQQYIRQPVPRGVIFPPDIDYDGRKLRRTAMRKTVDYNATIVRALENRIWQRDHMDGEVMQPDVLYTPYMMPPIGYDSNYTNAVTTRFVKAASNKIRCPVFCVAWTPEGRRLITGTSSGEFTLWNGLTFNFETILQAHDSPVRAMVWSHNDCWMITGDHLGFVKYWQSNMNNVKMFQAHREAVRDISFSPTDNKFTTCSDDGTVRIWDFVRCEEERVLRGHGADVKCVDWHPYRSLIASGSKDSQQPVKLWDPRCGKCFGTLHAHKSTVMDIKWNRNGNWIMTASRDHLLKLFDVRNCGSELQVFRGHKKEASVLAWHPQHEGLICSGGTDGSILFWHVGTDREVAAIEQAHDSIVWSLAWHPVGHILCSGSNDHSSKYWSRNLPGDTMRDKYNLNANPYGGLMSFEERNPDGYIPGMGPEDKVDPDKLLRKSIPGLDNLIEEKVKVPRKIPYAKPIPKEFQAAWNNDSKLTGSNQLPVHKEFLQKLLLFAPGVKYVHELNLDALFMYNRLIPIPPNSQLEKATRGGEDNLIHYIKSGRVPELNPLLPYNDQLLPLLFGHTDENDQMISDDAGYNEHAREAFAFGRGGADDFDSRDGGTLHPAPAFTATLHAGGVDFRENFSAGPPNANPMSTDSKNHSKYYHGPKVTDNRGDGDNSSPAASVRHPLLPPPPLPLPMSELMDCTGGARNTSTSSSQPFHNNVNDNRFSSTSSYSANNDIDNKRSFASLRNQFNDSDGGARSNSYRRPSSSFEQLHKETSLGYDDEDINDADDNDGYGDNNGYYDDQWEDMEHEYANQDPPYADDDNTKDYGEPYHHDKYGGVGGPSSNRFKSWNDSGRNLRRTAAPERLRARVVARRGDPSRRRGAIGNSGRNTPPLHPHRGMRGTGGMRRATPRGRDFPRGRKDGPGGGRGSVGNDKRSRPNFRGR